MVLSKAKISYFFLFLGELENFNHLCVLYIFSVNIFYLLSLMFVGKFLVCN